MVCHRDVKAGSYKGHECTLSLTAGEEREAALLQMTQSIRSFSGWGGDHAPHLLWVMRSLEELL